MHQVSSAIQTRGSARKGRPTSHSDEQPITGQTRQQVPPSVSLQNGSLSSAHQCMLDRMLTALALRQSSDDVSIPGSETRQLLAKDVVEIPDAEGDYEQHCAHRELSF